MQPASLLLAAKSLSDCKGVDPRASQPPEKSREGGAAERESLQQFWPWAWLHLFQCPQGPEPRGAPCPRLLFPPLGPILGSAELSFELSYKGRLLFRWSWSVAGAGTS